VHINHIIDDKTKKDIDERVGRVLARLSNPEPPLFLPIVRDALSLDLECFRKDDPSFLDELVSRLRVSGKQVLKRPTLLVDVFKNLDLRALYSPDAKRILIDSSQPKLKHRWYEGHEIGHSLLPWHEGAMLGDNKYTLSHVCHDQIEAEANYAAGRLLFLRDRFTDEALSRQPCLSSIRDMKPIFGNTYTTTFWRSIETWGEHTPIFGMITDHPNPIYGNTLISDKNNHYFIRSRLFAELFSRVSFIESYENAASYCNARKKGPLGCRDLVLKDDNGCEHIFHFESFSNSYQVLTLATYLKKVESKIILTG